MKSFVLLAEDDDETRLQLSALVEEQISGCSVSAASDVSSGMEVIECAVRDGLSFDAGILDVKLPATAGENLEFDEKLCATFRIRMPKGLVFHITGFGGDPKVRAHMDKDHPPDQPRGFVFDKGAGFPENLVGALKRYLYNTKIKEALDQVFVPKIGAPIMRGAYVRYGVRPFRRSTTNQLVDLALDISLCWEFLDQSTKDFVQRYFQVDESHVPVSVTIG